MTNTTFIADLPSMTRFADVVDPARFTPAPDNWRVYCCDVVNSTVAIQEGRYKAVNMAGAACIMAAINAAPGVELGYVFGGDGATLLAPEAVAPAIDAALARTRRLARERFDLTMRVGAVAVADIRAHGADLRVAMFELSPGNRTAMFAGGGAALTDRLVKNDTHGIYSIAETDDASPDLDGLSCRWEPLAARHGHMMCLLASARPWDWRQRADVYGRLITAIETILSPDIDTARPARPDNMRFRWPPRGLALETMATQADRPLWRHRLGLTLQSLFQAIAEWSDRKIGDYDAPLYRAEVRANSDFRRFDDVLRLILDCTPAQREAIEAVLADAYECGDIVYGTHRSDAALMTCLVFDLKDGRHLHFIDGTNGGFTLAAKGMKARIAATGAD